MLMTPCSYFSFSPRGDMEPGQSKSPGVPSISLPSAPSSRALSKVQQVVEGTGLVSHFHCQSSYLPSSRPAFPSSFDLGILFYCRSFEHPSTLYVGAALGATAAFEDWAGVWDRCSPRGHPRCAVERE